MIDQAPSFQQRLGGHLWLTFHGDPRGRWSELVKEVERLMRKAWRNAQNGIVPKSYRSELPDDFDLEAE